jgi:hydroxyacylglutathione hydrolase
MIPSHLSQPQAQGLAPQEPVAQYELGPMKNFVYFVLDWSTKRAAIIDSQRDLTGPLQDVLAAGFKLESCLLTHTHHDHIAGVPELISQFKDLVFYYHSEDRHRLEKFYERYPQAHFRELLDGQEVQVGSLKLIALHTPGHSAGELSYRLDSSASSYLFSGDMLFIRDCGRTDLDTGDNQKMFESLQKIKTLPKDLVILPGHHYSQECSSLLSEELKRSPPLLCRTVEELANLP